MTDPRQQPPDAPGTHVDVASSPCALREGGLLPPDPLLIEQLDALLEAERAGAKVLGLLAQTPGIDEAARRALHALQMDEAENAVRLFRAIRGLGAVASPRIGDFVQKTLEVDGLTARLRFVNRGQAWVARRIEAVLPRVTDPALRAMLATMRTDHLRNIDACETLVAVLESSASRTRP